MKRKSLLSMLWLCLWTFAGSGQAKSVSTRINLGETPWKFTKVVRQEINLAKDAQVFLDGKAVSVVHDGDVHSEWKPVNVQEGGFWTVDLGKAVRLSSVKLWFDTDRTRFAEVKLEVSADGSNWQTLSEGKKLCVLHKEGDFTTVGHTGTVGYTETVTATYLDLSVKATARYVRFSGLKCKAEQGQDVPVTLSEVEVNPETEQDQGQAEAMASLSFDDTGWQTVGIPHCYNEQDTYLNTSTGERCWRGEAWYRKKITIDGKDRGRMFFLEFQGVNIGAAVYVNGTPIRSNTKVEQPEAVTHVGSALPFVVDITPYLRYGEENQIAVRVSNAEGTFFTWPGFGTNEGFGQAMGGIVCPVYLHKKNKVHIPFDSYSPMGKWGTYFGTVSATKDKAEVRFQVNVENAGTEACDVELRTYLKDAKGKTALAFKDTRHAAGGQTVLFDRTGVVERPHLWYPIGTSGTPYLYTVENEVYVDGRLVDRQSRPWGIRQITWDEDFCYVNGEKCFLRGFGYRNNYPGLGAAVPTAFWWNDVARIARCGGNTLRVGHQPPFPEVFEACDRYGILLVVNSGDNEWALKDEPAITYKREYDRDVMVTYRNNPCVVIWESNNGLAYDGEKYLPSYTLEQVKKWDYIQPRLVQNRDGYPPEWDKDEPVVIGYTNRYEKVEGSPSWNTEVYGTNWSGLPSWCIARFDYDNEKEFSMDYVENYFDNMDKRACGWINWMLAETYGEGYTIYLNGMRNQKSLGSCAMDGNRFPKLLYRIFEKAVWVPFDERPGVALQSHWNFRGLQDVDAWSNCPYVELFVNGVSRGIVEPEARTRRCTWKGILWEPGTVKAVGLDERKRPVCEDEIASAGEPYALEVEIEEPAAKPDGERFELKANASDAFIATVRVVDKEGRWCPFADNQLRFEVEGEGVYKGSYNFYVTEGKPLEYHAPGDTELQAEGGLMRVAVRTTFKPGKITVKVSSDGLRSGEASVRSKKI